MPSTATDCRYISSRADRGVPHRAVVSEGDWLTARNPARTPSESLLCDASDAEVLLNVAGGADARWAPLAAARLRHLLDLPSGWNGRAAPRVSAQAARSAGLILSSLMQASTVSPDIVPKNDGGLQIEWHDRQVDIEIDVPVDGVPSVLVEDLATGEEIEGSLHQLAAVLGRFIVRLSEA